MTRFVNYLSQRPVLNIVLVICYYLLVVLPHEQIGLFIAKNLDKPYGRTKYNLIILLIGVFLLSVFMLFVWRGFKKIESKDKKKVVGYLSLSIVLIVLSINLIMVVNVEIIHIIQYAVMSVLIFPLLKNFNLTLFWITIFGALDEAYQYFYLAALRTDYYDFNDIVINLIGSTMGLIFLKSQGISNLKPLGPWYKNSIFYFIISIALVIIIAWATNYLTIYPTDGESPAPIQIIRRFKPGFWQTIPPKVKFHVIRPLEGLIMVSLLLITYSKLGDK